MNKHTPGPWIVASDKTSILELDSPTDKPCRVVVDCASGHALMEFDEAKANAEFIVRACNSHDDLLEALERIAELTHYAGTEKEVGSIARAAINKATGEP